MLLRLLGLVLIPLAMLALLAWSVESGALEAFAGWLADRWFAIASATGISDQTIQRDLRRSESLHLGAAAHHAPPILRLRPSGANTMPSR